MAFKDFKTVVNDAAILIVYSGSKHFKILNWIFFLSENSLGPVVQSVVSLSSSFKGHFVNCFSGFNIQYSDIFCWKNVSSFCTHIFQQNISAYLRITRCKF